ncbi:transcription repressor OFP17-like protein [Tanacetum coccineum]
MTSFFKCLRKPKDEDQLMELKSFSDAGFMNKAPCPSPLTPAYIKMGGAPMESMVEEDYDTVGACKSFENYLVEMIAQEGKMTDLMDVEELLYCWKNLKSPVFINLVCRFYGELCKDLFSGHADNDSNDEIRSLIYKDSYWSKPLKQDHDQVELHLYGLLAEELGTGIEQDHHGIRNNKMVVLHACVIMHIYGDSYEVIHAQADSELILNVDDYVIVDKINMDMASNGSRDAASIWTGRVIGRELLLALSATSKTVNFLKTLHRFHAHFLLAGDVNIPVIYQVDRLRERDVPNFATRRENVVQKELIVFFVIAFFHPSMPDPETLIPKDGLEDGGKLPPRLDYNSTTQNLITLRPSQRRSKMLEDIVPEENLSRKMNGQKVAGKDWKRQSKAQVSIVTEKRASVLAMNIVEDFIYLNTSNSSSNLEIMPPRMRTQSVGWPAAESLGWGTGVWVGRGGRGRRHMEGNDERVDDLNGQGNDQGMGANGGVKGVNGNVEGANKRAPDFSTIISQQLQNLLPAMLAQVSNRGNVGNQNGNVVNENIQENIGNVIVNGNQVLNRSFSERGDGVASIKRRRHDLRSDGVSTLVTPSEHG